MKRILVWMLLVEGASGAVATFTYVNGILFGLEVAQTNIIAGERLEATMILSNASSEAALLRYSKDWGNRQYDTAIGNFVVADENGNILPKTIPYRFQAKMGAAGRTFDPGAFSKFVGDV